MGEILEFKRPEKPRETPTYMWTCECGNDSFCLKDRGVFCASCNKYHPDIEFYPLPNDRDDY